MLRFRNQSFPWMLAFGIVLFWMLHLPFLHDPPKSIHLWRQANTLATARNFLTESWNIFQPRTDWRGTTNGVTGMEFPAYQWGLAVFQKVFGEKNWVFHSWAMGWVSCGAVAFYFLLLFLGFSRHAAQWGGFFFLFSPELFYFGFAPIPDPMALSCTLISLAFLLRHFQTQSLRLLFLSAFFMALGVAVKPQYILAVLPAGVWFFRYRGGTLSAKRILVLVYFAASVFLPVLWYVYAKNLQAQRGISEIAIHLEALPRFPEDVLPFLNTWFSEMAELLFGYPLTLALLSGFFWCKWCKKPIPFDSAWSLTACAVLLYHLLMLKRIENHSYYLIPWIPLGVVGAVVFLEKFWETDSGRKWVLLLLFCAPLAASLRIIPARWLNEEKSGLPPAFRDPKTLQRLKQAVSDNTVCVVGPDRSGSIYFYFLRKKGFPFFDQKSLEEILPQATAQGVSILYLGQPEFLSSPTVKSYLSRRILAEGNFEVWLLKTHQNTSLSSR